MLERQLAVVTTSLSALTERVEAVREEAKMFYGCVDGGADGYILLYDAVPKPGEQLDPKARARKGKWLRVSYPRTDVAMGARTDRWLRVHVVDSDTAEYKVYHTQEKTAAGSPSFARYDMYILESPAPA